MGIELYSHQNTALNLLRVHDRFALFMEQGTGKTFPVLFRIAELADKGKIKSALVVAPKAVCSSWESKIKLLNKSQQNALGKIKLDIVSYSLVWRRSEYEDYSYDVVVLDESHYIKSPTAKRTKACIRICAQAKYTWILTGTPTSNGQLCNIWSQFCAIDSICVKGRNGQWYIYPECLGGDSYYAWINRVARLDKYGKPKHYVNVSEIQNTIADMSYRITKEECLDLPEKLPDEILSISMDKKTKPKYKELIKSSAIESLDVLADNPLTRMLRARQICSGYVENDFGELIRFPNHKPESLKEFLEDYENKVVIFAEFHRSIDDISEVLTKLKLKHVVLDGRASDKALWQNFQEDDSVRAIICQYQSGAAGIDLYAADTIIFYEPTIRSDLNEQAKDRIHRVGQTRPCSYYYMLTEGSIERAIYKSLCNYEDFGEALFTKYLNNYLKGQEIED